MKCDWWSNIRAPIIKIDITFGKLQQLLEKAQQDYEDYVYVNKLM